MKKPKPKRPRPSRHFNLTAWRLLFTVPVEKMLTRRDEIKACRHTKLKLSKWDEQKAQFPREWPRLLAKRQRRLEWYKKHGEIRDGWTPPDPSDRRTGNKPVAAYLACRGYTVNEFKTRFALVPVRRKKGGHHAPWKAIFKVSDWLNPGKPTNTIPSK